MSLRLLVADCEEVTRAGLKAFLAGTDVAVVAEASSTQSAVDSVAGSKPDAVLLSAGLPDQGGLDALTRIKRQSPELPIVMLAPHRDTILMAGARNSGAAGVLLKSVSAESLVSALHTAVRGEQLWSRQELRRLAAVSTPWRYTADLDTPLTSRERDVLSGVTEGLTNQQIAARLGISYETVKEHVQHVIAKIGVSDRTQAAVWAVRNGLT